MGADMVMAMMSYKTRETDSKDGWDAEFHKRVAAVRKACKLGGWTDDAEGIRRYYAEVYGESEVPRLSDKVLKEAKAEFLAVIDDFKECIGFRDSTTVRYPERFIILSGGLSYGEEPTESYKRIDRFSQLPPSLLQAGGFE
jgi:hypothetical protein